MGDDPYTLLAKAIAAEGRGQIEAAAGYLASLNRVLGCPPFDSEAEAREALELAGLSHRIDAGTGLCA
jgi:hypothetical protein